MSKDDEAGTRDTGATPYLYADYLDARDILNERSIYRFTAEIESQYKKPYRVGDHVQSEWQYAGPDYPGPYPTFPPGQTDADCTVTGDALGGGYGECNPNDNCGVWLFHCCHKIIKFGAINGSIASVSVEGDDTCRVTYCSDKDNGSIEAVLNRETGTFEMPIQRKCQGTGHDPGCGSCIDCIKKYKSPVITYTSRQMSCSGTQYLSATGGNGGPYYWTVTGGTLSTSKTNAGQLNLLTAPATNANCANNIYVSVTDNCVAKPCQAAISNVVFNATNFTITLPAGSSHACIGGNTQLSVLSSDSGNNTGTFTPESFDSATQVYTLAQNPVYTATLTSETTNVVFTGKAQNATGLMIAVNCYTTPADAYGDVTCCEERHCYMGALNVQCLVRKCTTNYDCDGNYRSGPTTCSQCSQSYGGCLDCASTTFPCPPGSANAACATACATCSGLAAGTCGRSGLGTADLRNAGMKAGGCCPLSLA